MSIYDWLRDFQTLIVGFVGFVGVILTIWYNAKVARDQRRDEREHDREALRVALIEELQINRQAFHGNLEKIKADPPEEGGGSYVPAERMHGVYRSFLPRIGLLSQAEISKVMFAYLSLDQYHTNLHLIGVPTHTTPDILNVPAANNELLVQLQESMLGPIDEAIEALKRARVPQDKRQHPA